MAQDKVTTEASANTATAETPANTATAQTAGPVKQTAGPVKQTVNTEALNDKTVIVVAKQSDGKITAVETDVSLLTSRWHKGAFRYGMLAIASLLGVAGGAAGGYYIGKKNGHSQGHAQGYGEGVASCMNAPLADGAGTDMGMA